MQPAGGNETTKGAPLRLYNSYTRELETFRSIDPRFVRMYSCGPTVYNFAHLGNLRAYVFTDTLRRVLTWKGWSVTHVINITDVGHLTSDQDEGEDKMELSAERLNKNIWELAAYYTDAFKDDLRRLNVLTPTLWATATDHIQDMIAFARRLDDAGVTYRLPSGLYFDTTRVPDYGRLARLNAGGQEEGARANRIEGKRSATDFAVWRSTPPDTRRLMEWISPWGAGAPGWHLECSVMSTKYLGYQFDIHTGGIDHREIHHCNEIAQNQAYTGTAATGANWWMHNNFLVDRSGKLSKSKGGAMTLRSLIDAGVAPLAYRLLCLSAHYRGELDFTEEGLLGALRRLKRIVQAVAPLVAQAGDSPVLRLSREAVSSRGADLCYQRAGIEEGLSAAARQLVERFDAAISEDLLTPEALPLLEEALTRSDLSGDDKLRVVASLDLVLGLQLLDLRRADLRVRPAAASLSDADVEALLGRRDAARAAKDYATADALRQELMRAGIDVMDGDPLRWDWVLPAPTATPG